MAKRTASMKPAKSIGQPELPSIEETFANAKQVIVNTAEVAVVVSDRIDNLINIRKAAYEFWGNMFDNEFDGFQRLAYFKAKQFLVTRTYEMILDIVKSFELDEFLKEEMKDYFDDIMPKPDEVSSESELFDAFLVSGVIRPWGEKMNQLHYQILDEAKARKECD